MDHVFGWKGEDLKGNPVGLLFRDWTRVIRVLGWYRRKNS